MFKLDSEADQLGINMPRTFQSEKYTRTHSQNTKQKSETGNLPFAGGGDTFRDCIIPNNKFDPQIYFCVCERGIFSDARTLALALCVFTCAHHASYLRRIIIE